MIGREPYFEDVAVGDEIPALVKEPLATEQLVKYAGASGDFYQIHYDDAYARANGLPGIIAHGLLKCAFLGQMLTDFVGLKGTVRRIGCSYKGTDVPGDILTCHGKVTKKYSYGSENIVDLRIWIENQNGQTTTRGTATVSLPSP